MRSISTMRGDAGETSLAGGVRVSKPARNSRQAAKVLMPCDRAHGATVRMAADHDVSHTKDRDRVFY